jgi:hypothetical protein
MQGLTLQHGNIARERLTRKVQNVQVSDPSASSG